MSRRRHHPALDLLLGLVAMIGTVWLVAHIARRHPKAARIVAGAVALVVVWAAAPFAGLVLTVGTAALLGTRAWHHHQTRAQLRAARQVAALHEHDYLDDLDHAEWVARQHARDNTDERLRTMRDDWRHGRIVDAEWHDQPAGRRH